MTDALAHRGPDGEGYWQNESGHVLLGHRRLSIIDLSEAGHQPMHYLGRYTIVHNGELYNYIELKEQLQKSGYAFRSATGTEVIAAAYDCWKGDCLQKFDGMFAFAIWDEQNKELFAARDRLGEKPFYYSASGGNFLFAKVYELAKQHGVKVLLDGQGADELLAGYHKYYKWYWQELFRKGKLSGRKELKSARALGITEPFTWKNKIAAWFPAFASIVMERQYLLKAVAHPDLTKEFVQQQSREAYYSPPDHFTLNGVLHFSTFVHGLQELLRFSDRNSMAHGREVRLPFLSHELVEFLFSLPSDYKIRNGWTKWLLREAMKQHLPESIVWRRDKVGFEPPQKNWMQDNRVQGEIQSAKGKLVEEKILKPEVLQKKINPHSSHEAESYDWRYLSASLLFK